MFFPKKMLQKYLNRNSLPKKTLKNPYQNISEERSLPKNFRRDISTKRISEDNSIPKTNRETVLPKNLRCNIFCQKKTTQRTLCNFFKRNLYGTKSEEIFVPESVQRNLYQKMFEKKILTKSLQEISPAKKLRREISSKESLKNKSTKSLKRNLYQNNPPETSPKFLSREISTKQAFDSFFH